MYLLNQRYLVQDVIPKGCNAEAAVDRDTSSYIWSY